MFESWPPALQTAAIIGWAVGSAIVVMLGLRAKRRPEDPTATLQLSRNWYVLEETVKHNSITLDDHEDRIRQLRSELDMIRGSSGSYASRRKPPNN